MDTAYGGYDILKAGWYNLQNSWEECQASCQVSNIFLCSIYSAPQILVQIVA